MFNLLPESLKEKIKSEYKLRRFIVILVFVLFIEASLLIFFSTSWLISYYKEKGAIMETENMNKSQVASTTKSVVSTIRATNIKMYVLNNTLEYPKVMPTLDTILSKKTASIHISELSYSGNGKTGQVSVGGVSNTREALVAFQKNLETAGSFKTVILPVSNLAKDRDIVFSISITIAP